MTDAEWALLEPHLPAAKRLGRPRGVPLRAVVEALLDLLRTAAPWRLLPRDFPNRSTVQRYFYAWQAALGRRQGCGKRSISCCCNRPANGPGARPAQSLPRCRTGVIDSQSVKTTQSGGPRGYDAGNKIKSLPSRRRGAASAISSPTPPGIWWRPRSTRPTFRIAMARRAYWPRSATCSPGCAMSLPMAAMPAESWRRLWPDIGGGRSKLSSDPIAPADFTSFRGAGWSNDFCLAQPQSQAGQGL